MDVNNNKNIPINKDIKQLESKSSIRRKEIKHLGEIFFKR